MLFTVERLNVTGHHLNHLLSVFDFLYQLLGPPQRPLGGIWARLVGFARGAVLGDKTEFAPPVPEVLARRVLASAFSDSFMPPA
ncbi:MAG TPA: hypothetical protein EYP19_00810 [Desulfobacterales bacterium]|nr:hypothetical protein [Desulfobacterales bacterium]